MFILESRLASVDLAVLWKLFHQLSHSQGVFCQLLAAALQIVIERRLGRTPRLSVVQIDKAALRAAINDYEEFGTQTTHLQNALRAVGSIPPVAKSWIWAELFDACGKEHEALEASHTTE